MEERDLHHVTRAWRRGGLGRRDLLRLLGAGAGLATINAVLAACGGGDPLGSGHLYLMLPGRQQAETRA